jgi:hypothetical protein
MRVSIYEIAQRLELDAEQFEQLVSEGRLDGIRLSESCLQRVRRELFGNQHKPPQKHRAGSYGQ